MADYDPNPNEVFIGDFKLDFLPRGGTEGTDNFKMRFKEMSLEIEKESKERTANYGSGVNILDFKITTLIKRKLTFTTDEVVNEKFFTMLLGGGAAPTQQLGKVKIEFRDRRDQENAIITLSDWDCLIEPASGGTWNEDDLASASIEVTLLGESGTVTRRSS